LKKKTEKTIKTCGYLSSSQSNAARTYSTPIMTSEFIGHDKEATFIMVIRHAHRPLKDASTHLGVGTTWLKCFLRQMHPPYLWPHRQIASIDTTLMQDVEDTERRSLRDLRRNFILGGKFAVDDDGRLCMDKLKYVVAKYRRRRSHHARKAQEMVTPPKLQDRKDILTPPKLQDVKEIFGFSD
jgi:hypothetical protein